MYKKNIENTFNNLTAQTTDEDAVKMGILYLISSFLYTSTSRFVVPDETMRLVDSRHKDTFLWGKGTISDYIYVSEARFCQA